MAAHRRGSRRRRGPIRPRPACISGGADRGGVTVRGRRIGRPRPAVPRPPTSWDGVTPTLSARAWTRSMTPSTEERVRIAAIGDLHVQEERVQHYGELFAQISGLADVLVLCGDLTNYGKTGEAKNLADDLRAASIRRRRARQSRLRIRPAGGGKGAPDRRRRAGCSMAKPTRSTASVSPAAWARWAGMDGACSRHLASRRRAACRCTIARGWWRWPRPGGPIRCSRSRLPLLRSRCGGRGAPA